MKKLNEKTMNKINAGYGFIETVGVVIDDPSNLTVGSFGDIALTVGVLDEEYLLRNDLFPLTCN